MHRCECDSGKSANRREGKYEDIWWLDGQIPGDNYRKTPMNKTGGGVMMETGKIERLKITWELQIFNVTYDLMRMTSLTRNSR